MFRFTIPFVLFGYAFSYGQSQPVLTKILSGRVTDDKRKPVEFATVVVARTVDSVLVKGAITDTTGAFEINDLKAGVYTLKISSMGYKNLQIPDIVIDTVSVSLGVITLRADTQTLSEVVVKGERPVVERSLGKLTLNVSNSFFKTATNALDVLKRAPGLRIDQSGAISLSGGITPVVYVDGKQQPMTADELNNLSPDDIEQIEIIPNASAQYDGETRAVINIKLKRNKTLGWKGNIYGGYTINRLYSGYVAGASATFKTKRMSWYGRVGYSLNNSFLSMKLRRVVRAGSNTTVFDGDALLHYPRRPLSYQVSTDYAIAKNHSVGLLVKGSFSKANEFTTDQTTVTESNQSGMPNRIERLATTNTSATNKADVALDVNYAGNMNERGTQLTANLDYAHYQTQQSQALASYFANQENVRTGDALTLFGQFPATIDIRSARIDFTHPVNNKTKFEAGAKISDTQTDNELIYDTLDAGGRYSRDLRRSNRFKYDEQIVAGYGQYSQEVGKFSYNAGLRLEQTIATGNSITLDQVVNRKFLRWLPSAQVLYKFNDEQSLSVSYARKMTRPSFYDLNPFQFYVNKYLYTEGNPFLLPTRRNVSNITYTHKTVNASLVYTVDRDFFTQMPVQNTQMNVLYYTRVNLDMFRSLSFDVSASHTLMKWWKIQHNVAVFYAQTKSVYLDGLINNQLVSYYINGQQVFSLPNGFTVNIDYEYLSPTANQIYRTKPYWVTSLGLQKTVLKGLGSIQVNANDLFNSYRENFSGQFQDIDLTTQQKRNMQQATLRFTYNFGKSTYKQKAKTSGSAEEEGRAR